MEQRPGLTSTAGTGRLPRLRERYEISGGQYGGYLCEDLFRLH